jgi:hypothetical protein
MCIVFALESYGAFLVAVAAELDARSSAVLNGTEL